MSENPKRFAGQAADVTWDSRLCIHIGECGRSKGDLFVGGREPWCQPDVSSLDDVTDVVERCPTGALVHIRKDGVAEAAAAQNTVHVANNGPLYLRGDLNIAGAADDMLGVQRRAALCRCGHSKNKPFCDNSHEAAEFSDHGAVGEAGPGFDGPGGPLEVTKFSNGPLMLKGNLTIIAGTGRPAWRGTKVALCRCGHSKNKPFCDGSHKAAGFSAD